MPYDKNALKSSRKYKDKAIKRIPLDVQIVYYEAIKAAADTAGEPVNTYIKRAIQERMDREG